MLSPQVENGHVDIANELCEAFARFRLSGNEWQVLWVIIRKTYGWHKKVDAIPLSQIVLATGISRPHVAHAINKLLNRGVIKKGVAQKGNSNISTYELIKDYSKWRVLHKKAHQCIKRQRSVAQKGNEVLHKKAHSKENTKTTTKESIVAHDLPVAQKGNTPIPKDAVVIFQEAATKNAIKYYPNWSRDCKLMKELLNGGASLEEIKTAAESFFSPEHKFKGNFDIPTFTKGFNRLRATNGKSGTPSLMEAW